MKVTTETDLTSGRRTFTIPADPVPVLTPLGPSPGELRVVADPGGQVAAVLAVLRPSGQAVSQAADQLSRMASFPLPAAELEAVAPGDRPTVTFLLKPEIVQGLALPGEGAEAALTLLADPALQDGSNYVIDDLEVGIG